jgi:hypothetical protein
MNEHDHDHNHDNTQDNNQDPSLDPDQDARIRALLADLGTAPGETSMPPEVAARLDETLAKLVAERDEADREETPEESYSNVVPIRRRWATRAAAAAAAVIVVGAGGVAVANLDVFGGSATSDSSAGGSTSKAESLQDSATPSAPSGDQSFVPDKGGVPALSAASFHADVTRLLRGRDARLAALADPADAGDKPSSTQEREAQQDAGVNALRKSGCTGPDVTDGALPTPVRYDDQLAVLLVHPASNGERLVDVWTCSGDRKLDSASIPVPAPDSSQSSPGNPGLGSPSSSP